MAAKTNTKINDHGDVIFSEEDVIELLYTDPHFDISKLYFDNINKYSKSLKELGELKRIIQVVREKQRSMHLSPHQNVQRGHMMAAISGKGWRIPRNQGIHSEIYF